MTQEKQKPGLMRSLGAFVGEIVKAVKTDPEKYDQASNELKNDDEVILRRTTTTVDEVRLRRNEQSSK